MIIFSPKVRFSTVELINKAVVGWTYCGGVVLSVVVLLNTYSALAGFLFAKPFPGDVELTKMGIALAAFAFLPYCQITFSNISVSFFTFYASHRMLAFFSRINSLIALIFSMVLLWRMSQGLLDYREFLETSAVMEIPIWYVFVPIIVSIVLLMLASLVTLIYPEKHQPKAQTTTVS